jgi:hypothetical protein
MLDEKMIERIADQTPGYVAMSFLAHTTSNLVSEIARLETKIKCVLRPECDGPGPVQGHAGAGGSELIIEIEQATAALQRSVARLRDLNARIEL